ncbi:MAG: DUF927 domain-containing protein [Acholeplasmataceae bacterium]|nr:DUF927 domain-containing protein [Acholeplasmataceae bacterium]
MLKPNYVTQKMDFIDAKGIMTQSVCNLIYVKSIIKIYDNIDSISKVVLETICNGATSSFTINYALLVQSAESLLKELADREYLLNFKLANEMREWLYMSTQDAQNASNYQLYHETLGYYTQVGMNPQFLLGDTVINGHRSLYVDRNLKFMSGTSADYDKFLKTLILPYQNMRFALVLGLSSVAASYLKEYADVGTILLNLSGASSTGKTTTAQFIASLWGQPKISNMGLVRTFNTTLNALMHSLRGVSGVPVCLDDATTGGFKNRAELIYQLAQSEPKLRMTSDIQFRDQGLTWSGMIVITSEQTIVSDSETRLGIMARVLDTDNLVFTNSSEHAESIKRFISDNYGHIGRLYVRGFNNLSEDKIKQLYEESKKEVLDKLLIKDSLSSRIASKIAIIHMTAKLVNQILQFKEVNSDEVLNYMVDKDQQEVEQRHIGEKALEIIKTFVQKNHLHFEKLGRNGDQLIPHKGDLFGHFRFRGNDVVITILAEIVNEQLRNHYIFDHTVIRRYWAENDIIQKQGDRYSIKDTRLNAKTIKFNFQKDDETIIPWHGMLKDVPKLTYEVKNYSGPVFQATPEQEDAIFSDGDGDEA